MPLALDLAVGKMPDRARHGVVVGGGVEVDVHESLGHRGAGLWVVAVGLDLGGVDVDVLAAVEVELERDVGGQVELRVEGAGAVARLDGLRGRELVHVASAGAWAVQALLDAVALVLDLGEGQVDFSDDAGDVEAARVSDAAVVLSSKTRADPLETSLVVVVVVASSDWAGQGRGGEAGDGKGN